MVDFVYIEDGARFVCDWMVKLIHSPKIDFNKSNPFDIAQSAHHDDEIEWAAKTKQKTLTVFQNKKFEFLIWNGVSRKCAEFLQYLAWWTSVHIRVHSDIYISFFPYSIIKLNFSLLKWTFVGSIQFTITNKPFPLSTRVHLKNKNTKYCSGYWFSGVNMRSEEKNFFFLFLLHLSPSIDSHCLIFQFFLLFHCTHSERRKTWF